MPPELTSADNLEAYQVGNQVIVIARIRNPRLRTIPYLEGPRPGQRPIVCSLLTDTSIITVDPVHQAGPDLVAFRTFRVEDPIQNLRVQQSTGPQVIRVELRNEGFLEGGSTFDLPIISAKGSIERAITRMKLSNRRAVVVEYSHGEQDLFMNYQIARAYTNRSTFAVMRELGHPIVTWQGSGSRMGLFSMTPADSAQMVRITSAFESVAGGVRDAGRICLCSTNKPQHTVLDQVPTLDKQPCRKVPKGHGTYSCF